MWKLWFYMWLNKWFPSLSLIYIYLKRNLVKSPCQHTCWLQSVTSICRVFSIKSTRGILGWPPTEVRNPMVMSRSARHCDTSGRRRKSLLICFTKVGLIWSCKCQNNNTELFSNQIVLKWWNSKTEMFEWIFTCLIFSFSLVNRVVLVISSLNITCSICKYAMQ